MSAAVVPTRTVLVDGRMFEAGTLYSVADDVADRITAACSEEAAEDEEATAVGVEPEPEAADDSDADDAGVAPTA